MAKISIVVPLSYDRDIEGIDFIKRQSNKIDIIPIKDHNPSRNRNKGALKLTYHFNPSRNRNKGALKSKSDLIAFINGHTILSENWSDKVAEFFKKNKEIDIVGGPQLNHENEGAFARFSGYALASIFGSSKASSRYNEAGVNLNADESMVTSANLICKRKIFRKVRFDETLYPGEDPKFVSDAIKKGFKVAYSPDIIVYNKRRGDILSFIKQIYKYGLVRPKKETFKETLQKPFFLVPPLFVLYLLISPFLLMWSNLFYLPLFLYVLLNLIFSAYNGLVHKDIISIIFLPIIFLTIHSSYGIGFICGTISEFIRKL